MTATDADGDGEEADGEEADGEEDADEEDGEEGGDGEEEEEEENDDEDGEHEDEDDVGVEPVGFDSKRKVRELMNLLCAALGLAYNPPGPGCACTHRSAAAAGGLTLNA